MIEDFSPIELIVSATKEYPKKSWLFDALSNLSNPVWESDAYVHYVDAKSKDWKHKGCLDFQDDKYGLVVMDILEGNIIGGIEFVDNIKIEWH